MDISSYVKLMRPHQYIKNLFIFLPLFFALKINNIELLTNAFIAFIAFSLVASSIYILNDYFDIEEDKKHPKKKFRPLASGVITKKKAFLLIFIFFTIGTLLMWLLSVKALFVLLLYVILNIAYSIYLKQIAIVDITIIAIGFVLRLFIGSIVTNINLSLWIIIMTYLLALFMALAKRRDDVLIYENTGHKMRKVIDGYNAQFLDVSMSIMASVIIVTYIIYTTSKTVKEHFNTQYLYLTALFVILGILRYLQITFVEQNSGSPTKIVLKDRFLQITLLGWIITFIWILY